MPMKFKFSIKDDQGDTADFEGEFTDEDWKVLQRYRGFVEGLAETQLGKRGLNYGMSIEWNAQTGVAPPDTSNFPSDVELREFLHVLRPLILNDEPTFFGKVLGTISRRAPHKGWKLLQNRFSCTRWESMATITVTTPEKPDDPSTTIVLTSGDTLRKWLNAYEYHHDEDLQAEFTNVVGAPDGFQLDHIKGLMLELIREKTVAIVDLHRIIQSFDEKKGFSVTVKG